MTIRWYLLPDSAPHLRYPSILNSLDWNDRPWDQTEGQGERYGVDRPYSPLPAPAFVTPQDHVCGTTQDFAEGGSEDSGPEPVQYDRDDLPLCCRGALTGVLWSGRAAVYGSARADYVWSGRAGVVVPGGVLWSGEARARDLGLGLLLWSGRAGVVAPAGLVWSGTTTPAGQDVFVWGGAADVSNPAPAPAPGPTCATAAVLDVGTEYHYDLPRGGFYFFRIDPTPFVLHHVRVDIPGVTGDAGHLWLDHHNCDVYFLIINFGPGGASCWPVTVGSTSDLVLGVELVAGSGTVPVTILCDVGACP